MLKELLLSVVTPVLLLSSLQAATPMPMIVSHRGESKDAPENTMAAFRLAVQRGVGGMECDVYATADGVPVIMHDESMSRTTGVAAKITELTADVVTNTAATAAWTGSGYQDEKVPSLAEYLSLLNMKGHIKYTFSITIITKKMLNANCTHCTPSLLHS